jgi:hypothetical protein
LGIAAAGTRTHGTAFSEVAAQQQQSAVVPEARSVGELIEIIELIEWQQ